MALITAWKRYNEIFYTINQTVNHPYKDIILIKQRKRERGYILLYVFNVFVVIKDFLHHEINNIIDDMKELEFDFKTAYELRRVITTIALKNIISDRIALNNIQATISFDDKAFL